VRSESRSAGAANPFAVGGRFDPGVHHSGAKILGLHMHTVTGRMALVSRPLRKTKEKRRHHFSFRFSGLHLARACLGRRSLFSS
jgi:hypothetical protein